jgi:hypothetical protein
MKRQLAIGLTAALLSSVALAQTSAPTGDRAAGDRSTGAATETRGSTSRDASSARGAERTERGATGAKTETNVRVGVESRGGDRDGGVRARGVVRDHSRVELRQRRSVTAVSSAEPESRIVVRHGASKKVVLRKKKHGARYVVRSRRQVIDSPSVSVSRRSVRRVETSEPSVSVRSRTSVTRSQSESVRGGASIESRESGARSSTQTGVSGTAASRENRGAGARDGAAAKPSATSTTTGASSNTNTSTSTTSQPQR